MSHHLFTSSHMQNKSSKTEVTQSLKQEKTNMKNKWRTAAECSPASTLAYAKTAQVAIINKTGCFENNKKFEPSTTHPINLINGLKHVQQGFNMITLLIYTSNYYIIYWHYLLQLSLLQRTSSPAWIHHQKKSRSLAQLHPWSLSSDWTHNY